MLMLEEIAMEKKLSRSLQSPKGSAETKKNQDVTVGKLFPKSSRKRDKPGPKVEQFKKSTSLSSKGKQYGKRTTNRASHYEIRGEITELAVLHDDYDVKRSKKQNLRHLLNFHWKPRENAVNMSQRSLRKAVVSQNSTLRDLMTTQKHKYNKEQFLQANFQFVVRAEVDYSVHLADPDKLVEWNFIEQIRVPCYEPVTCPICLDYPVAGKITRCGHIYCWPCILRYLSLTDKPWMKCPICFEAVHRENLKSVRLVDKKLYNTGEEITLQLMKREHGTTIATPVSELTSRTRNLLTIGESSFTTAYSKLLLANEKDIRKIIEIEEEELNKELKKKKEHAEFRLMEQATYFIEKDERNQELMENERAEICSVEEAIHLLDDRKKEFMKKTNEDCTPLSDCSFSNNSASGLAETSILQEITDGENSFIYETENSKYVTADENVSLNKQSTPENDRNSRIRYESDSSNNEEIITTVTAEDLEINTDQNSFKYYYFYQAMDGQHIYLHSLNARMLERQYGSLEESPLFLVGKIVEIESGSMTEELRKRLRYLQHLPITCQFQVVEVDLGESVSAETRSSFKDQLERRNKMRQKRAREEKKLQKRAESFARKQYGCSSSPPRRLRLDSLHHFPECGSEEPCTSSSRNRSPVSSRTSSPTSSVSRRSISPMTSALDALSINNNTFAQKLKDTNKNGGWQKRAPPVFEGGASSSSSRNLISDAVEKALIKARLVKESNEQNFGKNKKKKKQKPVPLCSVGMVYTNH